ncbi:MAG: ATP-binding protein [Planctomycetes bacterium]|nr:ATP-binding protein [Planctomycetota bacterium]
MRYLSDGLRRCLEEERKMALLVGPRQVGKTTLARSLLPAAGACFNWDVETDRRLLVRSPGEFWREKTGGGGRVRIVLDEIHKYPRWKRLLKGLFDAHAAELEILVTGSGRLDVYQRGGDSLLGRYFLHHLHPFTVGELLAGGKQALLPPARFVKALDDALETPGSEEALERIERFTGFPEPLFKGREEFLVRWRRTRRDLVLREDLRDLTRIREMGLLESLALLLPDKIGSPLSLNGLREDLGVAFNTVRGWVEALSRLYYLFELRPFAGKLSRTLRREAKIYFFDPSEIPSEGARFENLVALHLLKLVDAWNDAGQGDFALHYVRDKEKREADFLIVERRRPFLLVECKLTDRETSPSLDYFAERLKPAKAVLVVRQGRLLKRGGHLVIPASRFLALM